MLRVWCAVDCGRVINPDGAKNQIEGGIVQALSWTLIEELRHKNGRILPGGVGIERAHGLRWAIVRGFVQAIEQALPHQPHRVDARFGAAADRQIGFAALDRPERFADREMR